jgi:hypothetical protein
MTTIHLIALVLLILGLLIWANRTANRIMQEIEEVESIKELTLSGKLSYDDMMLIAESSGYECVGKDEQGDYIMRLREVKHGNTHEKRDAGKRARL